MNRFLFVCSCLFAVVASVTVSNNTSYTGNLLLPIDVPAHTILYKGNGTMCTRLSNVANNSNVTGDTGSCQYGCQACVNFCAGHGLVYYCCQEQYCCCYTVSGPCTEAPLSCRVNYC